MLISARLFFDHMITLLCQAHYVLYGERLNVAKFFRISKNTREKEADANFVI